MIVHITQSKVRICWMFFFCFIYAHGWVKLCTKNKLNIRHISCMKYESVSYRSWNFHTPNLSRKIYKIICSIHTTITIMTQNIFIYKLKTIPMMWICCLLCYTMFKVHIWNAWWYLYVVSYVEEVLHLEIHNFNVFNTQFWYYSSVHKFSRFKTVTAYARTKNVRLGKFFSKQK